jgi:hypothetical protein
MIRANGGSRAGAVLLLYTVLAACGEGAKLVADTGQGGIVTYPYRAEQGPLVSPLRTDAVKIIEERCTHGYTVVREGEAKGRTRMVENAAGSEAITQKRWGVEFRCQP